MKFKNYHSFHIVDQSPWPLINSMNLMNMMMMTTTTMKFPSKNSMMILYFSLFMLTLTMILWWRDIIRESFLQGHHTFSTYNSMKISMILFISSEIMFFLSFFWSFFHFSLAPEMEIGNSWPPSSINMVNPFHIPLLNTILLLSSGASITWTHYSILKMKYETTILSLLLTIFLGTIFTLIQAIEYTMTEFSMNDNVFGSTFFMATGFHGLHVIIGTTFLMVNLIRIFKSHLNNYHHFSLEAAAWYWHFVDVIWIYLYIFIYWWFFI